jgi:hypothetical protein
LQPCIIHWLAFGFTDGWIDSLFRVCVCVMCRASSILQKKTKLYGPKNALDYNNPSSSWNSEGVANNNNNDDNNDEFHYLIIGFGSDRIVMPKFMNIQFQAGFGCEQCHIYVTTTKKNDHQKDDDEWIPLCSIELVDVHDVQTHEITYPDDVQPQQSLHDIRRCTAFKIVFDEYTDFYKRIIVYQLELWGDVIVNE